MNVSLKEQLSTMESKKYPFIRRDKGARAAILANCADGELLVAAVPLGQKVKTPRYGADVPRAYGVSSDATIRKVSVEYFDNNYWEGVN